MFFQILTHDALHSYLNINTTNYFKKEPEMAENELKWLINMRKITDDELNEREREREKNNFCWDLLKLAAQFNWLIFIWAGQEVKLKVYLFYNNSLVPF